MAYEHACNHKQQQQQQQQHHHLEQQQRPHLFNSSVPSSVANAQHQHHLQQPNFLDTPRFDPLLMPAPPVNTPQSNVFHSGSNIETLQSIREQPSVGYPGKQAPAHYNQQPPQLPNPEKTLTQASNSTTTSPPHALASSPSYNTVQVYAVRDDQKAMGFKPCYERRWNSRTRTKNLRCFPQCGPESKHNAKGFCGCAVKGVLQVPPTNTKDGFYAWAALDLKESQKACDFKRDGGASLDTMRALERSKQNPRNEFLPCRVSFDNPGQAQFYANEDYMGWDYRWTGHKHTSNLEHCLFIFVFQIDSNNPLWLRLVGVGESSPFKLTSARTVLRRRREQADTTTHVKEESDAQQEENQANTRPVDVSLNPQESAGLPVEAHPHSPQYDPCSSPDAPEKDQTTEVRVKMEPDAASPDARPKRKCPVVPSSSDDYGHRSVRLRAEARESLLRSILEYCKRERADAREKRRNRHYMIQSEVASRITAPMFCEALKSNELADTLLDLEPLFDFDNLDQFTDDSAPSSTSVSSSSEACTASPRSDRIDSVEHYDNSYPSAQTHSSSCSSSIASSTSSHNNINSSSNPAAAPYTKPGASSSSSSSTSRPLRRSSSSGSDDVGNIVLSTIALDTQMSQRMSEFFAQVSMDSPGATQGEQEGITDEGLSRMTEGKPQRRAVLKLFNRFEMIVRSCLEDVLGGARAGDDTLDEDDVQMLQQFLHSLVSAKSLARLEKNWYSIPVVHQFNLLSASWLMRKSPHSEYDDEFFQNLMCDKTGMFNKVVATALSRAFLQLSFKVTNQSIYIRLGNGTVPMNMQSLYEFKTDLKERPFPFDGPVLWFGELPKKTYMCKLEANDYGHRMILNCTVRDSEGYCVGLLETIFVAYDRPDELIYRRSLYEFPSKPDLTPEDGTRWPIEHRDRFLGETVEIFDKQCTNAHPSFTSALY